jgi:Zn-finger nucleic acid-binding protein
MIADARHALDSPPYSRRALSITDPINYLPCPVCSELMSRRNFGYSSGVIVDVCLSDGVWFDDGELAQVIAFCASGELTKAEKVEKLRQHTERAQRFLPIQMNPINHTVVIGSSRREFVDLVMAHLLDALEEK